MDRGMTADEEQAALRAEMERLRAVAAGRDDDYCLCGCSFDEPTLEAIKRAESAEAEGERLTRECLDREASEVDARERLRRADERLAAVEALAEEWEAIDAKNPDIPGMRTALATELRAALS